MTLEQMKVQYVKARNAYYNRKDGKTIMTDAAFDKLEDQIRKLDPEWSELKKTGATVVGKKTKVELAAPMPSLAKMTSDNDKVVNRFLKSLSSTSEEIAIMFKYDGSSLQSVYERRGKDLFLSALYTRGDGITGKNVSHFIPYVKLPQVIRAKNIYEMPEYMVIRHEAVMREDVYQSKHKTKYPNGARAMASGIFNKHTVEAAIKDIDLIALRVLKCYDGRLGEYVPTLSQGLDNLDGYGFQTASRKIRKVTNTENSGLSMILDAAIRSSAYVIDGLVVCSNAMNLSYTKDGKVPDWARAYKNNTESETARTKIEEVIWQPSHTGKLVPKARVTPVKIGPVTVTYVALHNAEMAKANGWGVGAVVDIIRSGEIIPKIINTHKTAAFKLPLQKTFGSYEWDGPHLRLVSDDDNLDVMRRKLGRTLEHLGIEHVAASAAKNLAEVAGYEPWRLIKDLFVNAERTLVSVGVSSVVAKKAAATLKPPTIVQLMEASHSFPEGLGTKRFEKMAPLMLDIDYKLDDLKECDAIAIELLGNVMGAKFNEGRDIFLRELKKSKIELAKPVVKKVVKGKLTGQFITMTGYRDKHEIEAIENAGGTMVDFGSKTTILLYREGGKASSKLTTAQKKGIEVKMFKELKL